VTYQKLDKYSYDFDILERIEEMAKPWRYKDYDHPRRSGDGKIRLAYLAFGMLHINSVLIKINSILAQYHDKDRFEVTFFVPEPRLSIYRSQQAKEHIKMFHKYGCHVVVAGGFRKGLEKLLKVGEKIYNYKPDVLITSALLAEFEHYFITCLRPAPLLLVCFKAPRELQALVLIEVFHGLSIPSLTVLATVR
jgi:predicted O-linked N-acetylglucosamine transferase (SPINDLY family)